MQCNFKWHPTMNLELNAAKMTLDHKMTHTLSWSMAYNSTSSLLETESFSN